MILHAVHGTGNVIKQVFRQTQPRALIRTSSVSTSDQRKWKATWKQTTV